MKKTALLLCAILCGCTVPSHYENSVQIHISSNVGAQVYLGNDNKTESKGTTPLTLSVYEGEFKNDRIDIFLEKQGYLPAKVTLKKEEKHLRLMSTSLGDEPVDVFIWADDDIPGLQIIYNICNKYNGGPYGFFEESSCHTVWMPALPFFFTTALPSAVTRPSIPYIVDGYAPQQVFVEMKKDDTYTPEDQKRLEIRRFVLRNFESATSPSGEFYRSLRTLTELPEDDLKKLVTENPTPDGAANAVVEAYERKRNAEKENLSESGR